MAALARMPAPLPGLREPAQVEGVLRWACSLLDSPSRCAGRGGHKIPCCEVQSAAGCGPRWCEADAGGLGLEEHQCPCCEVDQLRLASGEAKVVQVSLVGVVWKDLNGG